MLAIIIISQKIHLTKMLAKFEKKKLSLLIIEACQWSFYKEMFLLLHGTFK